jgi:metal-dependent HD superfamily phosphatase/phosphodiesterase
MSEDGMKEVLFLSFRALEEDAVQVIENVLESYPKARKFWQLIASDEETRENWKMANFVAVTGMGMNDHGESTPNHHSLCAYHDVSSA